MNVYIYKYIYLEKIKIICLIKKLGQTKYKKLKGTLSSWDGGSNIYV